MIKYDELNWAYITSSELCDHIGMNHFHLLELIDNKSGNWRADTEHPFFESSEYVNSRGRKYRCYNIYEEGLSLLSTMRSCTAGDKGIKFAEILRMFGRDVKIVVDSTTRYEDQFYQTLKEFLPGLTISRQFGVGGFFIDFCIPEIGLFVEYDEEQHFTNEGKKKDLERWKSIKKHLNSVDPSGWDLIRVRKGMEIQGLSMITSYLVENAGFYVDKLKLCDFDEHYVATAY